MLMLIGYLLLFVDGNQHQVLQRFETANLEDPLTFPYSMHFAPDGKLFLADFQNHKIYIWKADGGFIKSFGRRGQGPGELHQPTKVTATKEHVYVWDQGMRINVFDHDGGYVKTIGLPGIRPRNFAVLGDGRILAGYNKYASATDVRAIFSLFDAKGEKIEELKSFQNEAFLSGIEVQNTAYIKAYLPELDIQRDSGGKLFFGFSQSNELFSVDDQGQIDQVAILKLPTGKPNDQERETLENMPVPGPSGFVKLKDVPNLKISYDFDKPYYTHFVIRKDKAVFALTPQGGAEFRGNGYHLGQYYIIAFPDGKVLSRGQYHFPEHSTVLFRDGRILGAVVNDDDEFEIQELLFHGL